MLLISSLSSTCQNVSKDSVLVSIKDIREANLVFIERDKIADELRVCRNMNEINTALVMTDDSVISHLETEVRNLKSIDSSKDKIHEAEYSVLDNKYKKLKKVTLFGGGTMSVIIILLLL